MTARMVLSGREVPPIFLLMQEIEGVELYIDSFADDDHPDLPRFLEIHRTLTARLLDLRRVN